MDLYNTMHIQWRCGLVVFENNVAAICISIAVGQRAEVQDVEANGILVACVTVGYVLNVRY